MKSHLRFSPICFFSSLALTIALTVGLPTIRAFAQCSVINATWSLSGSGNWTTTSDWSSATVPNNSSTCPTSGTAYTVAINSGGSVTLDNTSTPTSITANSLTLGGELYLNGGASLTLTTSGVATGDLTIASGGELGLGVAGTGVNTLNVGGNLTDSGTMYIGTPGSTAGASVTVNGTLDVTNGSLVIWGAQSSPSAVTVRGAAPSTLEGGVTLYGLAGGAVLNYAGGGGITQIGGGVGGQSGALTISGTNVSLESAGVSGNSALDTLTTIASNGFLEVDSGASVTTSGPLTINRGGVVRVGFNGNPPISILGVLNVGGSLTDSGTMSVGAGQATGDVTVNGTLNVASNGYLQMIQGSVTTSSPLTNTIGRNSSVSLFLSSTLALSGSLINSGTLDVSAVSTLDVGGSLINRGTLDASGYPPSGGRVDVGGSLINSGTLDASSGGGLGVGGPLTNNGAISIEQEGSLNATGSFTQTGGTTSVEGRLSAASLDVKGGTYTNDTGVTNLGTVSGTQASGSVNIGSNGWFTDNASMKVGATNTQGTVNNAGIVAVGGAGILTLLDGGSYTQTSGVTNVNGKLIAANVAINGGILSGTGTVNGAATIGANAQLSPGFLGVGTMKFDGSTSQPSLDVLGTWDESIYFSSFFGTADVNGELTLGANSVLDIFLSPLYDPKVGTSFTIADFGSLSGTFGSILNDTFDHGKEDWIVTDNSNDIVLTAGRADPDRSSRNDPPSDTPEPGSLMLFITGMGAFGIRGVSRRVATRSKKAKTVADGSGTIEVEGEYELPK